MINPSGQPILPNAMSSEARTNRNRQFREDEAGQQWTRRMRPDGSWPEWEMVEAPPQPEEAANDPDPLCLYLVMKNQAEGELRHWCLFVGRETGPGTVYQVTGDNTFMHYQHEADEDIRNSDEFYTAYQLCELSDDGLRLLDGIVHRVPPPQAENRASVTENCQTWVIRVLRELQSSHVVDEGTVDSMEAMLEPIK